MDDVVEFLGVDTDAWEAARRAIRNARAAGRRMVPGSAIGFDIFENVTLDGVDAERVFLATVITIA